MILSEDKALTRAIEAMQTDVTGIQHVIDHTSDSQEEDVRLLCKRLLELENSINESRTHLCRHL